MFNYCIQINGIMWILISSIFIFVLAGCVYLFSKSHNILELKRHVGNIYCHVSKKVIKSDHIILTIYTKANAVGNISYIRNTGQIRLFTLDEEYKKKGIDIQLLQIAIDDLKSNNISIVWTITEYEHPFWSNVFNKSFKWSDDPPHSSVAYGGYVMSI